MTDWVTAPGKYYQNMKEVQAWCLANFGPEHETKTNPITRKVRDNHGNWKWKAGEIRFRYEKDLAWFLLMASTYQDQDTRFAPNSWGWWPTGSTGPK